MTLALKSSWRMTSVISRASTSGLVSVRESDRQWSISWCPQEAGSLCSERMDTQRDALGAWRAKGREDGNFFKILILLL